MNAMPQLGNPTAPPGLPALANPQMLQQKVQQAGQQPNGIPNDLLDMLALQQVVDAQEHAKAQLSLAQASQGQPPPIADQLKQKATANARGELQQKLATMQQQASQQQAQAQAQPQGIDSAPSNLGRSYAGGGIIAFDSGGQAPSASEPAKYLAEFGIPAAIAKYGYSAIADIAPGLGMSKAEVLKEVAKAPLRLAEGAGSTGAAVGVGGAALSAGAANALSNQSDEILDQLSTDQGGDTGISAAIIRQARNTAPSKAEAAPAAEKPKSGPTMVDPRGTFAGAYRGQRTDAKPEDAPAPKDDATLKAITAIMRSGSGGGSDLKMPVDPNAEYWMKKSKETYEKDPDAEFKTSAERHKQYVGLDALLKEQQDRIAAQEDLYKNTQSGRSGIQQALLGFAHADPRKGLGLAMAGGAEQYNKANDEWNAEDVKFSGDMMKLKNDVTKAKIEGRTADAAAGQKAIDELMAAKRTAMQSGTQMVDVKERSEAGVLQAKIRVREMQANKAIASGQLLQAKQLHEQNRLDEAISKAIDRAGQLAIRDKQVQKNDDRLQFIGNVLSGTKDEARVQKLIEERRALQNENQAIADRYHNEALGPFKEQGAPYLRKSTSSVSSGSTPSGNRPPISSFAK